MENIEILDFDVRVINALTFAGITCIGEVLKLTPTDLLKMDNFGKTSLVSLENTLKQHTIDGHVFRLGMDIDFELENERKERKQINPITQVNCDAMAYLLDVSRELATANPSLQRNSFSTSVINTTHIFPKVSHVETIHEPFQLVFDTDTISSDIYPYVCKALMRQTQKKLISDQIWFEFTNRSHWACSADYVKLFNALGEDSKLWISSAYPTIYDWISDVNISEGGIGYPMSWNIESLSIQCGRHLSSFYDSGTESPCNEGRKLDTSDFSLTWSRIIWGMKDRSPPPSDLEVNHIQGFQRCIDEFVEGCKSKLKEREIEAISRRLGTDGLKAETLEEVGNHIGLTRERIRQIEQKGHGKLRRFTGLREYALATKTLELLMWVQAGRSRSYIEETGISSLSHTVSDAVKWYAFSTYGSVAKALKGTGKTYGDYLFPSWISDMHADSILSHLSTGGEIRTSRIQNVVIDKHYSRTENRLAIECHPAFNIYNGHIRTGAFSIRPRRTADIHNIMRERGESYISEQEIYCLYRKAHPEDECSPRDLSIVLTDASYLFLKGEQYYWMSIENILSDRMRNSLSAQHNVDIDELPMRVEDVEVDSVATQILQFVVQNELVGVKEICRGLDSLSEGSISRIIVTDSRIIWMAPGLLGLWCDRNQERQSSNPKLFTNYQGWKYAEAIHAGETRDLYPSWTSDFECQLVKWLSENGHTEVYHSVLAVCSVSDWSESIAEKEFWNSEKSKHGKYTLERQPDYNAALHRLTLSRFISLLQHIRITGSINWVRTNRIFGFRSDSKVALWPMVFLVSTGCVHAAEHWQLQHNAIEMRVDELLGDFMLLLEIYGQTSWEKVDFSTAIGLDRDSIKESCANSWVPASQALRLFDHFQGGEQANIPDDPTDIEDDSTALSMFDDADDLLNSL